MMRRKRDLFSAVLAGLALLLSGCAGYKIGPIQPTFMHDVHTIAVPTFKNETLYPRIEVLFADSLIKQLQQDGTFRVVSSDRADAILEGTITKISRKSSRSVRGNVLATKEFTLSVTIDYNVTRRDPQGPIEKRSVVGSTSYFVTGDIQQDERQALPLAASDAAGQLVSEISEGW
ncbi:MAG: LPS assembly lipoprotein LptE [Verrucomicrobiota bacterium]|nr:LPS assembly lipoprotein LptE [Verrucomicrobiota bacterium]